jgi:hypothetical protein
MLLRPFDDRFMMHISFVLFLEYQLRGSRRLPLLKSSPFHLHHSSFLFPPSLFLDNLSSFSPLFYKQTTNKSLASAGRRSQGPFAYPLFFDPALISIVSRIEVIKSLPSSELPRKTTQTSSAVDNGVRDPDELNLVASSMLILMTLTVLATHHRVQRGPVQEAPPTLPRLQTRCQLC